MHLAGALSPEQLMQIKTTNKQIIGNLHMSLGLYIRNEYLYHNAHIMANMSKGRLGYTEDDASSSILRKLWNVLQNES
jgi:hypothetical protein